MCKEYVPTLYRDADGTLWFGTLEEGVVRYDGEEFVHFTVDGVEAMELIAARRPDIVFMEIWMPRLDQTEEERLILSYVEQHGSINNAVCRTLLEVDRRRSSYLLDKLYQAGQLGRSGVGRGTRYDRPQ